MNSLKEWLLLSLHFIISFNEIVGNCDLVSNVNCTVNAANEDCSTSEQDQNLFQAVYEAKLIDYDWMNKAAREKAIQEERYIPINNAISGIKIWLDRIYVAIPRWKLGVPVTLASLPMSAALGQSPPPPLQAFPNWEMQALGNCAALQYVQTVEIDPYGNMWIIDSGRVIPIDGSSYSGPECQPKLVVINLNSVDFSANHQSQFLVLPEGIKSAKARYENFKIATSYTFPSCVASVEKMSLLNDLVLDMPNYRVYIVDMGMDPGIIVYNTRQRTSFKVRDETMKAEPNFRPVTVAGTSVLLEGRNLDGIALTAVNKNRTLYYCPLGSHKLFSVPTTALQPKNNISSYVTEIRKKSVSDGMTFDTDGNLYLSLEEENAIAVWNIKESFDSLSILEKNNEAFQWIDSVIIDDSAHLWLSSNRLQNFLSNSVTVDEINYRILKTNIAALSYLYPHIDPK